MSERVYRSPLRIGEEYYFIHSRRGPLAFGAMPKARQSAKTNPGMYSKGTKAKNAAEKKVHQDAVRAALAFTQFHGKSTVWAMKHGDFAASVTKNILDKALAGKLVYCNSDRREDSILTELESERLITWIKGCAQNTNPAFDAEISQQVIKMLRVRWTFNKTKKHSKVGGCIPLTAAEMRLVRQEKAEVSRTWLTNFGNEGTGCEAADAAHRSRGGTARSR